MRVKIILLLLVVLCSGCRDWAKESGSSQRTPSRVTEADADAGTDQKSPASDAEGPIIVPDDSFSENTSKDKAFWRVDGDKNGDPYDKAAKEIKVWQFVCKQYRKMYKKMPASFDALKNTPSGIPLINEIPKDPWGNLYIFEKTQTKIKIQSRGPDGTPGNSDDIIGYVDIADTELQLLKLACTVYRRFNDRLPADLGVLTMSPPNKPLLDIIPKDPWGNVYLYEIMGERAKIYSCGPDGRPDTVDDIAVEIN